MFTIQIDAASATATYNFDEYISQTNATPLPLVDCANALCTTFQQAFFQASGLLVTCRTQLAGGNVTIIVGAPGTSFTGGGGNVRICP